MLMRVSCMLIASLMHADASLLHADMSLLHAGSSALCREAKLLS